ncbi:hypothetical protein DC31_13805 [Microbacterium sp. CH12i]|nr:hypothetical protein DC31_13805 [Microbacterium sp. CH12i]
MISRHKAHQTADLLRPDGAAERLHDAGIIFVKLVARQVYDDALSLGLACARTTWIFSSA